MNLWLVLIFFGSAFVLNDARIPYRPPEASMPFVVYFTSRYRGLCVGSLISRMAVMTAAVCVCNPKSYIDDTQPINVVVATTYRHPRRGIKVQVTKILIPLLPDEKGKRIYLLEMSSAVLLLKRKVPDALAEIPLRPIYVDIENQIGLRLQEECLIAGWHFFNRGDKIYAPYRFLLQRNLRVQFMNVVKKSVFCDTLALKFQTVLDKLGYNEHFDSSSFYCLRDPERTGQPCHGMYGAPMICRGELVGIMMAPDAQWTNCTSYSAIFHKIHSKYLLPFMTCIKTIFAPEFRVNMDQLKRAIYEGDKNYEEYDLSEVYDHVVSRDSREDDE